MEKTKLGISMPLAGLIIVGVAYFSGYVALLLLVGYVLLKEENRWLKRVAVQSLLLLMVFSGLSVLIHLIPDALTVLERLLDIFKCTALNSFFNVIGKIETFLNSALTFIRCIVFMGFGASVFAMKEIKIPVVNAFIEKHF